MKSILLIAMLLLFTGCNENEHPTDSLIDMSWMFPACEPVPCTAVPCEGTIYGYLTDDEIDIMSRIDINNIKMNHYIDGTKVDENWAEILDVNGSVATKNSFTLPEYGETDIKHILIIEFTQIK